MSESLINKAVKVDEEVGKNFLFIPEVGVRIVINNFFKEGWDSHKNIPYINIGIFYGQT